LAKFTLTQMRFLKNFLQFIYRIWFYLLIAIAIFVLFPFLVISIFKEKWYPFFFKIARVWAKIILFGMGFIVKRKELESLEKKKSYVFIANHTSMIDIMLMFYIIKDNPFVFVGKKELTKFPVFGFFYRRTCILVDRADPKSRKEVFVQAQKRLKQGLSICIFPEGGVPKASIFLNDFKDGAFRLAIDHQIPIVPICFYDNKRRFPYDSFKGSPGKLRTTILNFVQTQGTTQQNKQNIKEKCKKEIYENLINNQYID